MLCGRSRANYPRLVADALRLKLDDVTCAGATIADVLSERHSFQPPQIEAVGTSTRLVTVTIGGNDVSYLGNLAGLSCEDDRSRVPILWRSTICHVVPQRQVDAAFGVLQNRMQTLVGAIRLRAPRARIVLVDYLTVLPERGSCPSRSPLTDGQMDGARRTAARLAAATYRAAKASGALYVAASRLSGGHDVCGQDPWIFPFVFNSIPLTWGPFSYHPNERGMAAVAGAIFRSLDPKTTTRAVGS